MSSRIKSVQRSEGSSIRPLYHLLDNNKKIVYKVAAMRSQLHDNDIPDEVAQVIGGPSADAIWGFLYEETEDTLPAIQGLAQLGIPPKALRELLVGEVLVHWPDRMPRLVLLLEALKDAGLVDAVAEHLG